ncbi:MAG: radical SAM protein [Deltaproteobacteria bacterium]|nr:radical SAM protein [Deltaproteobacteria bacterium]
MKCRGCFARFEDVRTTVLPRSHLPREAALQLTTALGTRFSKVTFAGGEPTLAPWLPDLIAAAKAAGATTMLVTNASRLDRRYLDGLIGRLDWLAMSIDSGLPATQRELVRATARGALSNEHYISTAEFARKAGIRVKVNTVVGALNAHENMAGFIEAVRPERWKVLQVLPVEGQNDGEVEPLLISRRAFREFLERHQYLAQNGIAVVGEDNESMTGSYAMVDPAGRFFDNTAGRHSYSRPILSEGIDAAWGDISFHLDRFVDRGGVYQW